VGLMKNLLGAGGRQHVGTYGDAVTFTIDPPIDDLARALAKFPHDVMRKAMRASLRAASKPVLGAAKQRAPMETGALRKALGVGVRAQVRGEVPQGIATMRARRARIPDHATEFGGKRKRVPANYIWLVALGTRPHSLKKGGRLQRYRRIPLQRIIQGEARTLHGQERSGVGRGGRHPGAAPNPFMQKALYGQSGAAVDMFGGRLRAFIMEYCEQL